jgi:4-amino-4-deoxy-L-arabinose transferase-like glycosyltransferase
MLRILTHFRNKVIELLNNFRQNELTFLLVLFTVTCLFTGIGISVIKGFHATLSYDEIDYDLLAQRILHGEGYRTELGPTAHKSPGYPYVVAIIYSLAGEGNYAAVRAVQAVLNALTALLIYSTARRLFGQMTAMVAGIGWAFYPLAIYMSAQLYTETLTVAILVLFLFFLSDPRSDKLATTVAAGILAGLLLLTRSSFLGVFGLLLIARLLVNCANRSLRGIYSTVLMLLFAVLVVAPWSIRNYQVFGTFVPLTTVGGVAIWQGNNDYANGGGTLANKDTWRGPDYPDRSFYGWSYLSEPESDAKFKQAGLKWIRKNPGRFLLLIPKKVVRLWSPISFTTQSDRKAPPVLKWVIIPPYLGFLSFAFWGIWQSRFNWQRYLHLYAPLVGFTALAMLTFGGTRYGFGMVPTLVIFAARAFIWVLGALHKQAGDSSTFLKLTTAP